MDTRTIKSYTTEWPTATNVVISLLDAEYPDTYEPTQIGIVEVKAFKSGPHKGEAYIWNLHVNEDQRGNGGGKILLRAAINAAIVLGCDAATLDWSIEESPEWVFDWYMRNGFDERQFGRGCAFMVKVLKGGEEL